MDVALTLVAACALAGVQLLPRLLSRLQTPGRRRWWSAAGGVAVAFVFLHLLPELVAHRAPVATALAEAVGHVRHGIFLLALLGVVVFYGIEVLARRRREHEDRAVSIADQLSIAVFALYYALIGYLLWDQVDDGVVGVAVYALAMGLHFLVVDRGLREHHRGAYAGTGRWLLAAAVLLGWLAGWVVHVPAWLRGTLLAVLAGAIVLVALKEELPAERAGHYGAFVSGASGYAALLYLL